MFEVSYRKSKVSTVDTELSLLDQAVLQEEEGTDSSQHSGNAKYLVDSLIIK